MFDVLLEKPYPSSYYVIIPQETDYDNYYQMLASLAEEDVDYAEVTFEEIKDHIDETIGVFSDKTENIPYGYLKMVLVYNYYTQNIPDDLGLSRSDYVYSNISYMTEQSNKDFYHFSGDMYDRAIVLGYVWYNPQFNIVLDLTIHDYLPQDIQNWRVKTWGFESEAEYKHELQMQWKRVEIIREIVETMPAENYGTGWMFAYDLTEAEWRPLQNFLSLEVNNLISNLRDDEDFEIFNKFYPSMMNCYSDVIELTALTFRDPDVDLEQYYTEDVKSDIRERIKSIESQIEWLNSQDAIDLFMTYLPDLLPEYGEFYYEGYTIPLAELEKAFNALKENSYIQAILEDGQMVDMRLK